MTNRFFMYCKKILLLLSMPCCLFSQESRADKPICESQFEPVTKEIIHNQAEYNAFFAALKIETPDRRGDALEAFTREHPSSILNSEAMVRALAAFQRAGNQAKTEAAAERLLQDDVDNVCALAVVLSSRRAKAIADYQGETANAKRGLQLLERWQKPQGMSQAEYKKQYYKMAVIFYGAAAFGALIGKDFAVAREYYLKSLSIEPKNLTDNRELAIADLEMTPIDPQGFWYAAKAINLAQQEGNVNAGSALRTYVKAKYRQYHGDDDGWDQIIAEAATESGPPTGFTVTAH